MKVPLYQVDAFTGQLFQGNPAAVCPLPEWLDDGTLQAVAAENNLSETAYFLDRGEYYELRWFTPKAEIDLAGHPTLATAFVICRILRPGLEEVRFETGSGPLTVRRTGDWLTMDFPARPGRPCPAPEALTAGLGLDPVEVLKARDYLVVYETEDQVRALRPRQDRLLEVETTGIIVTAPGREVDFVSRFFAPRLGIPEDPVTGSAHCTLIPYWSDRLKKKKLEARQVSERGGEILGADMGRRVAISGRAVLYLEGTIFL
jgi:PhzF family phenazine biosynthesis protein